MALGAGPGMEAAGNSPRHRAARRCTVRAQLGRVRRPHRGSAASLRAHGPVPSLLPVAASDHCHFHSELRHSGRGAWPGVSPGLRLLACFKHRSRALLSSPGHIWGSGRQIFKATELPNAAGLGLKVLRGSHRDCLTCLKADRPGPARVMENCDLTEHSTHT